MIRGMIRRYDSDILNCPSAHLFAYMNLCKTSLNLLEKCCCQSFLCALEPACSWRCACCCQSGVCSLERACWCRAVLECRCKVVVQVVACCHSAACSLGWACWCRCRALLQVLPEGAAVTVVCLCVRFKQCFGAGMLVSGCRWTVLLEGAVEIGLLVVVQGLCLRALQGCLCRVLLHAAAIYCYNSGLCALELVCWCRCRVVL